MTLNVAKKADTPLSGVSNRCPAEVVPKFTSEKSSPLASLQFVEEIDAPDIIIPLHFHCQLLGFQHHQLSDPLVG